MIPLEADPFEFVGAGLVSAFALAALIALFSIFGGHR